MKKPVTNFLRTYRANNMTVMDVAQKHRISPSTVRDWVSGRRGSPETSVEEIPYYVGFSRRGDLRPFRVVMLGHRKAEEIRRTKSLATIFSNQTVEYTKVWANVNPIVGWTMSKDQLPGYFAVTVVSTHPSLKAVEGIEGARSWSTKLTSS